MRFSSSRPGFLFQVLLLTALAPLVAQAHPFHESLAGNAVLLHPFHGLDHWILAAGCGLLLVQAHCSLSRSLPWIAAGMGAGLLAGALIPSLVPGEAALVVLAVLICWGATVIPSMASKGAIALLIAAGSLMGLGHATAPDGANLLVALVTGGFALLFGCAFRKIFTTTRTAPAWCAAILLLGLIMTRLA